MDVIYHEKGRDAHYKIWNAPDEDIIIYFHRGVGSLVFQDEIYPICEGAICFIKGKKLRYTMPENPIEYDRCKIYLEREKTEKLLSTMDPLSEFYRLFSESSVVYARLPNEICKRADEYFKEVVERKGKVACESAHVISFFALLGLIFEYKQHSITAPRGEMARVVEYVNSHYGDDLTLNSICRAVNISKSHLCRRFKATLGMTVADYILNTRLAAAKSLLLSSDLFVSEISNICGFSSVSYFCQIFGQKEGQTAREYRKNINASN